MAQLHSRYVRGALVYWEGHRKRIVAAIGKDVWGYELLPHVLNADGTDPTGFTSTVVEAGGGGNTEFSPNDTAGRVGTITADNADNDGGSYQLLGSNIELTSDQDFYFGCEFQVNDADQTDFLFGIAVTDTALLAAVADAVYFESLDGGAGISTVTEKNSTETQNDSAGTLVDATDIILEFYFNGTNVEFFIDGVSVNTHTANIPDDVNLRLSLEFLTGEAIANTCNFKWCRVFQIGR